MPADEPSNERLLVVSCDSHADPGDAADYAPYFEPRYRELFVRSTAAIAGVDDRDTGAEMFSRDHVERRAHAFETFLEGIEERDGGLDRRLAHGDTMRSMTVDAATRIRELEADGVVAEVVFPNALPFQYVPEISRFGPELRAAGLRAYNRWLADLCAESPGRTVGVAQLPAVDDVEATVREIRASAAAGLRGVQCPRPAAGRPPLSDASYEPIWQSCVELALPLHVHIGWGGSNVDGLPPDAARDPAVGAIMRSEIRWLSRRPLWLLIWGQVLERHPELAVVFVEQYADWVPATVASLDAQYDDYQRGHAIRAALPRRPSEYWRGSCFVCASAISRAEVEMRDEIGVSTMLFGTDYPHFEGTWPNTRAWIAEAFAGVAESDVRAILGENAVRCYGLDRAQLAERAAIVGPTLGDLTDASTAETAEWLAGRGVGRPVTRV